MQKYKRGDVEKWDQTDSPEIADRGETSETPRLPFGGQNDQTDTLLPFLSEIDTLLPFLSETDTVTLFVRN